MPEPVLTNPHLMGIDFPHPKNCELYWPHSPDGSVLVVCFRTGAMARTVNGEEKCLPGCCMVNSPEFPERQSSLPGADSGFRNDWIRFDAATAMQMIKELRVPCNCLIPTEDPEFIAPTIRKMQSALKRRNEFTNPALLRYLWILLYELTYADGDWQRRRAMLSSSERRHYSAFVQIREEIVMNCRQPLDLEWCAKSVKLGLNRFFLLYGRFFNGTPYSDHLNARIMEAKRLLITSKKPVKFIASFCGWDNELYFSRIFHRKVGMSPSRFRHEFTNSSPDSGNPAC